MKYFDLTESRRIVVTGAQRSGTTFVAQMIAHELDIKYCDEGMIRVNDEKLLEGILKKDEFVLQAPGLMHMIHRLPDDVFVIVMIRDIFDIITSQIRIKWGEGSEGAEKRRYVEEWGIPDWLFKQPISYIKYRIWWNRQKNKMKPKYAEIQYSSLKDHPLYVKDRKNFKPKQIKHET